MSANKCDVDINTVALVFNYGLVLVSQQIVDPRAFCKGGRRETTTRPMEGSRMDVHKNARTTPRSRPVIVQRDQAGETVAAVARAFACAIERPGNGSTEPFGASSLTPLPAAAVAARDSPARRRPPAIQRPDVGFATPGPLLRRYPHPAPRGDGNSQTQ